MWSSTSSPGEGQRFDRRCSELRPSRCSCSCCKRAREGMVRRKVGSTRGESLSSRPVFGDFMKRLWNVGVLVLAGLMFFLVPVGRRTPAQHLFAIFSTPPAREAATAFTGAVHRAAKRAVAEIGALRRSP